MEAAQNRMNLNAWLCGLYNSHAYASVRSSRSKYPTKPFEFGQGKKKTPQQEADDFMRFMLQHNAQKAVKEEIKEIKG